MKIMLHEQLKKLRQSKGNTQEDLASYLGITVQAVSKWERNEGLPDITLLPGISAYYNVSVDDLLGVGEAQKEKRLSEYRDKGKALFREGKNEERAECWREAAKEFPNDLSVLHDLMYALSTADRKGNAEEIISIGERILKESTDNELRDGALRCLCFTHHAIGNAEEAKKVAGMSGIYNTTANQLMPHILEGEEAVAYCQDNIQTLVDLISANASIMVRKGSFSPEEEIPVRLFALDLFKLLYGDENYGFYHCRVSDLYLRLARAYRKLGKAEETLGFLEKATEFAIRYDTLGDGRYTAFMVNRGRYFESDAVKDHFENESGLLHKELSGEEYSGFFENERFKTMTNKLKATAVL